METDANPASQPAERLSQKPGTPNELDALKSGISTVDLSGKLARFFMLSYTLVVSNFFFLILYLGGEDRFVYYLSNYGQGAEKALRILASLGFIFWFWKAYRNLTLLKVEKIKFSPIYTIIGVVAPLVNLYLPYALIKEIAVSSAQKAGVKFIAQKRYAAAWWALLLVTILINYLFGHFYLLLLADDVDFWFLVPGLLFMDLFLFSSLFFLFKLISFIGRVQKKAAAEMIAQAANQDGHPDGEAAPQPAGL